jgi:hypothetical protein
LLIEYTDFVKIVQPKLSEKSGQKSGLFSTPASPHFKKIPNLMISG